MSEYPIFLHDPFDKNTRGIKSRIHKKHKSLQPLQISSDLVKRALQGKDEQVKPAKSPVKETHNFTNVYAAMNRKRRSESVVKDLKMSAGKVKSLDWILQSEDPAKTSSEPQRKIILENVLWKKVLQKVKEKEGIKISTRCNEGYTQKQSAEDFVSKLIGKFESKGIIPSASPKSEQRLPQVFIRDVNESTSKRLSRLAEISKAPAFKGKLPKIRLRNQTTGKSSPGKLGIKQAHKRNGKQVVDKSINTSGLYPGIEITKDGLSPWSISSK